MMRRFPLSLRDAWLEAVRAGDDERMNELSTNPDFLTAVDSDGGHMHHTALHLACLGGHYKAVALLLAVHPTLGDRKTHDGRTALHYAASRHSDKIVALLLAASPHLIHAVTNTKETALHHATNDKVVTLLLAANPDLITQVDKYSCTALHYAASMYEETLFSQLLGYCPPSVIDARDDNGSNVLQLAAQRGHSDVVTRILDVRPELITAVDNHGFNAVHYAVRSGNLDLAERMLSIKPEAICAISQSGDTVLHEAIDSDKQFVEKLWRMNPQALHTVGTDSQTPFGLAVASKRQDLIELFRSSVSFDEFMSAFAQSNPKINFQKRYRPAMKKRCESLWDFLNQDVASIVFEYLGFAPTLKKQPRKRAKKLIKETPSRCYQLRTREKAKN